MLKKVFNYSILILLSAFLFTSCNEDTEDSAILRVSLVDAPADYEAVYIDIEDVLINPGNEEDEWVSLTGFEPVVYNLLELTNGYSAFLGEAELPEGKINEIRFVLGEDNELWMDGEVIPLKVPSGSSSGLKLKIDEELVGGFVYHMIVDFDAGKSVVKAGNSGKYILKPVLRAQFQSVSGAISGVVIPADVKSIIYAVMDGDTASTYADTAGNFMIHPLYPGLYSIIADPAAESGLEAVEVLDVQVAAGNVTLMDTIRLQIQQLN